MNIFSEVDLIRRRIDQLGNTPQTQPAQASAGDVDAFQGALDSSAAPSTAPFIVPEQQIDALVQKNAGANGVDPALLKAIIANESGFDASATSNTGAQGLMQLMPSTAADLGVQDAYDPAQNIAGGSRYLAGLMQRFSGNTALAVAAYNAGPGAVEKYGGIPPFAETQRYVTNVLRSYNRYRALS